MWLYDLETAYNFFSATFKNYKTKEVKQFVIYKDRNDLDELIKFAEGKWLVGYNNMNFDNQIMFFLKDRQDLMSFLDSDTVCKTIYDVTQSILNDTHKRIYKKDYFKWIDLMKAGNLNQKSLKMVGTLMKWHKLQDLPYEFDSEIEDDQVETILDYNLNDVEITEKLLTLLEPQIKLRFDISKEYNVNVESESDSGIANRLLEKFYSEGTGIEVRDFRHLRTNRNMVRFRDVVYTRNIHFQTKELDELLENVLGHVCYGNKIFFRKSIIFDGVKYQLGIGGLHSDDQPEMFESTDEVTVTDADIASMYPNLILNNYIYPEHLSAAFLQQYNKVKNDRIKAKHEGNNTISDTLKIVLNATFGKLGYEHHWLYDPLAMLRVTVNGQLYLLMLIERLVLSGFKVISANTDGIVALVPKDKEEEYYTICKDWEKDTNFELEYTYYKRYVRRDVNNYLSITKDDKVKTKGDFNVPLATEPEHLLKDPWVLRRGFDKPIVAKALNEYFINDKPIEETIRNHTDIYDFCTSLKTDKKFLNEFHTLKNGEHNIETLQQSVRYYVSTNGGTLLKREINGDRAINYCVGKTVTIFNNYFEADDYDIDYIYYINEAQKIIDLIDNPQLKLF